MRVWESRRPSGQGTGTPPGAFAFRGRLRGRQAPHVPLPVPGATSQGTTTLPLGALTLTKRPPSRCFHGAVDALPPFPGNTRPRSHSRARCRPAAAAEPVPAKRRLMSAAPVPRPRHTPGQAAMQQPGGGRPGKLAAAAPAQRSDSAGRNVGVLQGSALKAF